jgi:hypothetical protein
MNRPPAEPTKFDLVVNRKTQGAEFGSVIAGECPPLADIVAKVENRTMPKISRKRIFRHLYRCNTP